MNTEYGMAQLWSSVRNPSQLFSLVCSASLLQFLLAADSGSIYDPHPTLSYSWNPDQSVASCRTSSSVHPSNSSGDCQNGSDSSRHQPSGLHPLLSTSSYELGPHPADPHSAVLPTSIILSSSSQSNFASGANGQGHKVGNVKGNGNWDEHRFEPGTCTQRVSGQELWVYGGQGGFVILTSQRT
jgi:hypothetical protein